MKTFRLIAASLFFAAIFAVSTFAQVTTVKVGLINTLAFDNDKAGITKYTTAMNSLESEFQKDSTDLNSMATRINTLQGELEGMQKQLQDPNPKVPVNRDAIQSSFNTKYTDYEKLTREYKFKQEDAKVRFDRRRQQVLGPILQDIGKAMQEFAKQKGYTLILDGAKMEDAAILLAIGDEKIDVTKDFITFYNARPATTAATTTTTPPKQQ
jgi:Skp family chaperone for outer membrane proteins